ncbi:hypothetical protein [Microcoleus sp. B9-D4]|uniref:hypothetical protein n=1 Tax=Microcoleus sp. B9-D4 TaxID=2818711 RepID=UPI002FD33D09
MTVRRAGRKEYGEKKVYMNNAITPTAQAGLDALAKSWNVSRSELLERIGRGMLQVSSVNQETSED